jgi:hypothetical protein
VARNAELGPKIRGRSLASPSLFPAGMLNIPVSVVRNGQSSPKIPARSLASPNAFSAGIRGADRNGSTMAYRHERILARRCRMSRGEEAPSAS